jgi:PAS domain-containing protein
MGDPCVDAPPDDDAMPPAADSGPRLSVAAPPPRAATDDLRAADELRARLKWFLLGRVAVISGFLAMVAIAYLGSGGQHFDVPVDDLLLVVVATYAVSALSAMLLPYLRRAAAFAYVQIAFDVGLVTGVIHLTGGTDSPFAFLYSLPIINGAVLLFEGGALFAAVCSALAYDGLLAALAGNPAAALPQPELSDPHIGMRIATTNVTFGLIAFLSSILTRRLHAAEQLLREKQAERDHLALLQDTLARTIGSGLITTDAEGRITSINATAQELAGTTAAGPIGQDIGAIFAPLRLTPSARLRFLQSAADPIEFAHPSPEGARCHLRCVGARSPTPSATRSARSTCCRTSRRSESSPPSRMSPSSSRSSAASSSTPPPRSPKRPTACTASAPASAASAPSSRASRSPTPPCWSAARAAPARRSSRAPSTPVARAATSASSPSTAAPSPST